MTSMGHFEAEALARSHVQLLCDGVQLRLTVSGKSASWAGVGG